jgi:glycosyltransferase involved in cell wall biosynthesis
MRLSFVIPTRNQARFIRRCIDGCVAQGIEDSEIIVVDGLSTDGTQQILEAYGDRIRWTSERDSGQADAVNKGIAAARGDVIAWINSDDAYASPGAIAPLLRRFEAEPEVDVIYGEALVVDDQGKEIRPYVTYDVRSPAALLMAPQGPSQPATLFRRAVFARAGGLRTDLHLALDYELWLRLFAAARRVERVPEVLALMTSHPSAKSISSMGRQIAENARVKRAYASRMRAPLHARARMEWSILKNWLYVLAVKTGLRRAV